MSNLKSVVLIYKKQQLCFASKISPGLNEFDKQFTLQEYQKYTRIFFLTCTYLEVSRTSPYALFLGEISLCNIPY